MIYQFRVFFIFGKLMRYGMYGIGTPIDLFWLVSATRCPMDSTNPQINSIEIILEKSTEMLGATNLILFIIDQFWCDFFCRNLIQSPKIPFLSENQTQYWTFIYNKLLSLQTTMDLSMKIPLGLEFNPTRIACFIACLISWNWFFNRWAMIFFHKVEFRSDFFFRKIDLI